MKIVIVGDGKVGDTLIQYISGEGHSVTVIDKKVDIDNTINPETQQIYYKEKLPDCQENLINGRKIVMRY